MHAIFSLVLNIGHCQHFKQLLGIFMYNYIGGPPGRGPAFSKTLNPGLITGILRYFVGLNFRDMAKKYVQNIKKECSHSLIALNYS